MHAHTNAFLDLQDSLQSAVTHSYPDPEKVLCIFTDASEKFWSGVVTNNTQHDMKRHVDKKEHTTLAFLGSAFKDAEQNWTTFEKEGFSIFQTFERMDFPFMASSNNHVFTDHRNLLSFFAPLALEPALGRHIVTKGK